jgi:hypothetical protein
MNDLLASAVAAHGGLERWNQISSIAFDASVAGAFWHVKGKGDTLKDVRLEVDTTRQLVTIDLAGKDKRYVFEPHRVVVQHRDGSLIEARKNPERSFDGHQFDTPWDDVHLAYFVGEAQWTYLNMPFLYTWPGFVSDEIIPIEVDGETWRRLKVTFPDQIKSHTREQIACSARTACCAVMTSLWTSSAEHPVRCTPPTTATSTASSCRPHAGRTRHKATAKSP